MGLLRQTCKACGRPDKFNFKVPDSQWEAIVPEEFRKRVLCLPCFDDFAVTAKLHYHLDSLFFAGDQVAMEFKSLWVA